MEYGRIVALTSGKVPLEKTLPRKMVLASSKEIDAHSSHQSAWGRSLHQQTSLSASTVTDDNKLASDLGHTVAWTRHTSAKLDSP